MQLRRATIQHPVTGNLEHASYRISKRLVTASAHSYLMTALKRDFNYVFYGIEGQADFRTMVPIAPFKIHCIIKFSECVLEDRKLV